MSCFHGEDRQLHSTVHLFPRLLCRMFAVAPAYTRSRTDGVPWYAFFSSLAILGQQHSDATSDDCWTDRLLLLHDESRCGGGRVCNVADVAGRRGGVEWGGRVSTPLYQRSFVTFETDADPASSLGQHVSVGQEAGRVPALIQRTVDLQEFAYNLSWLLTAWKFEIQM